MVPRMMGRLWWVVVGVALAEDSAAPRAEDVARMLSNRATVSKLLRVLREEVVHEALCGGPFPERVAHPLRLLV